MGPTTRCRLGLWCRETSDVCSGLRMIVSLTCCNDSADGGGIPTLSCDDMIVLGGDD